MVGWCMHEVSSFSKQMYLKYFKLKMCQTQFQNKILKICQRAFWQCPKQNGVRHDFKRPWKRVWHIFVPSNYKTCRPEIITSETLYLKCVWHVLISRSVKQGFSQDFFVFMLSLPMAVISTLSSTFIRYIWRHFCWKK